MYRLLGNEVLDTEELGKHVESETGLRVREDISNATKRDDAAALRLELDISILGYDDTLKYEDEQIMNELPEMYNKLDVAGLLQPGMSWMGFVHHANEQMLISHIKAVFGI